MLKSEIGIRRWSWASRRWGNSAPRLPPHSVPPGHRVSLYIRRARLPLTLETPTRSARSDCASCSGSVRPLSYEAWRRGPLPPLAGFPPRAVTPIVVEPVGGCLPPGQSMVLGEASELCIASVDPAAPVGAAGFVVLRHGVEMRVTSEPQAGQWKTPSGRRRISG
jgi:hypothetical protein